MSTASRTVGSKRGSRRAPPERERAARENAERDDLFAALVHDLRNPLNAVLNWTYLLQRGALDAETTARALDSIRRHSELQVRLLADFVELSTLGDPAFRLEREPVDLAEVVLSALEPARARAEARSVRIETSFEKKSGGARPTLSCDRARVELAVRALVDRAVESAPAGTRVEVAARSMGEGAQVAVTGEGGGFSAAERESLFAPLAPSDPARGKGNLRLELAIAERVARHHGGTLEASSPGEGHGSTFVLRLPFSD